MQRPLLFLALCGALSPAFAADEAVTWKLPWRPGVEITHAVSDYTVEEEGDERFAYRMTLKSTDRVLDASPAGFVLQSSSADELLDSFEGDAERGAEMRRMLESMAGMEARVHLDAGGHVAQVHVDPAQAARIRAIGEPIFREVMEAQFNALPDDARTAMAGAKDAIIEAAVEDAFGVESLERATREAYFITELMGRTYMPGQPQEVPGTMNDTACGVRPAMTSVWLDPTRTDARMATLKFRREAQPDEAQEGCGRADFSLLQEGDITFDRETGIIETMNEREQRRQGEANRTSESTGRRVVATATGA